MFSSFLSAYKQGYGTQRVFNTFNGGMPEKAWQQLCCMDNFIGLCKKLLTAFLGSRKILP